MGKFKIRDAVIYAKACTDFGITHTYLGDTYLVSKIELGEYSGNPTILILLNNGMWIPEPFLKLRPFFIGDKVAIIKRVDTEPGWDNAWSEDMSKHVGDSATITKISKFGIQLNKWHYGWPPSSLRLVLDGDDILMAPAFPELVVAQPKTKPIIYLD